ncbi:SHOCT domain-containing protein [Stenotrophomonas mori]|uniref:SHOCT domain-containing protein n=1 Tax=Stenotrophomonas mori TaxID=2871096 RepID=A0ABT0SHQ0_9GAMM|nr:SHOCT domain-containing protein [Stenotrophomonas mori]MCL7714636.1 SHOCT domain-containing protein [Stenotrophomonas mori]
MDAPGMQSYHWVVWVIGVTVFAGVIGWLIVAAVRAGRRPPELPSAARQVQRQAPQAPEVEAQLRELAGQHQAGRISDADYERRRATVLAQPPGQP